MKNETSLTPEEVAEILKIKKNTVYEMIKRKEIPAYRVGRKLRVEAKDVEAYKMRGKSISNGREPAYPSPLPSESLSAPTVFRNQVASSSVAKGVLICGQDMILDTLSRHWEQHPQGVRAFRSFVGSYAGLLSLYQGEACLATAHLWDGDTDTYNLPYVRRLVPAVPTIIIHLVKRWQGLYVKKGNPKNIRDWSDLTRHDIRMINREKGSGTRILLDEKLRIMGVDSEQVNGYEKELTSHLALASAIGRGEADAGLGNQKAALQVQGIDFIPLQQERYELVIKKKDLKIPQFQAILEILRSPAFQAEVEGMGGYDITEMGQIIAEI